MSKLTPAERIERAKHAAHTRWSRLSTAERRAAVAPGLRAMLEHFEKQVDPDGALSEKERAKLAKNARQASWPTHGARPSRSPGSASRPLRWAVTEMVPQKNPTVGDRVRIERDESRYPSKGTWPQFRGRVGTIVEINLGEYGVVFGKTWPHKGRPGKLRHNDTVTWFQPYEITGIGEAATTAVGGTHSAKGYRWTATPRKRARKRRAAACALVGDR